MRYVFAGAGHVAELTAKKLQEDGAEIVIIDHQRERIDELSKDLDVSFLEGDVTKPEVLDEADPNRTDILFCLTDCDQSNILCAVAGRALGYKRIIPSIANPKLAVLCRELDFDEFITPALAVANQLAELAGEQPVEQG